MRHPATLITMPIPANYYYYVGNFVTARASRTPVSAQPQLDGSWTVVPIVIEIRGVVSSLGSWQAPFGGVGVASEGLFVYY